MADQVLKARDGGVSFDIGIQRPGGGYAVAAFDEESLSKLDSILTELQSKLEQGQEVALNAATLAALETINVNITEPLTVDTGLQPLTDVELRATPVPVDTGLVQPLQDGGNVAVSNHPSDFPDSTSQLYLENRYGGGKQSKAITVSSSGDTAVVSPALGNRVQVYWVSAVTIPTSTSPPVIKFRFGANDPFYSVFAVGHWEVFTGGVDEPLVVNLSNSDTVALTVHYKEI